MRRIQIVTVVALILTALIFAYSQSPQSTSQTGPTGAQAQRDQPVKAKKVLVKALPKGVEGIVLKDGVFSLKPGYKFVRKSSNTVVVALNDGGPGPVTPLTCSCVSQVPNERASGTCDIIFDKTTPGCQKGKEKPCTDLCQMNSIILFGKSVGLAIY
jgi:hypothetical protein